MSTDLITLDFYNNSFYVKLDNKEYFTEDPTKFLSDFAFPYAETVKLLSYEPQRNLYVVEYVNNTVEAGIEPGPIAWFEQNKSQLANTVATVGQNQPFVPTLETERVLRFSDSDWVLQRNQEELQLGLTPTLNQNKITQLLRYRQQLRDLTNTYSKETPANQVVWPTNPIN